MNILQIKDRKNLEDYFRQALSLHLYSLGDLDDFYWPYCTYYGSLDQDHLKNVCLLYQGDGLPVFLALGEIDPDFLTRLSAQLPEEFYAHLSPRLENVFRPAYQIEEYGPHLKMFLDDFSQLEKHQTENTYPITENDLPAVKELYKESYPGNAFDPRMLETGQYFGLSYQKKLVSIAGIHVYSPTYRVAALGNITTHPEFRSRGFGRAVTTRLCQELADQVTLIGLNVKSDNQTAIALYLDLGFRISDDYGEFSLQKRG